MDSNNPYSSITKLLRQSAVEKATKIYNSKADDDQKIKATKVVESLYTKTERALILELGRIGNNVKKPSILIFRVNYIKCWCCIIILSLPCTRM